MKKLLITVCLSGLLSVPSVVLGAEMAGASLYGSFRTGLTFGSGDASVRDYGSRWGIKGSHEVSEGLTASYKYEGKINTTNAESFGGAGHKHAAVDESIFVDLGDGDMIYLHQMANVRIRTEVFQMNTCTIGNPFKILREDPEMTTETLRDEITGYEPLGTTDKVDEC